MARQTSGRAVRLAVALVVQAVLVVVAVWAPLSARVTGDEVRLRVAPFDPVDPFRGAYVDLDYPDLPSPEGEGEGTAFVPLTRSGDVWVGGPVTRTRPEDGPYLACDDASWRLSCGTESLFLPQDEARAMEDAVRGGTAVAVLRVDGRGHAALLGVEPD